MIKPLVIGLVLVAAPAFGQRQLVGIKGGAVEAAITSRNFPDDATRRRGFTGGLTYEYLFGTNFSCGADLLYMQRGFGLNLVFTDRTGAPTGEAYLIRYRYDYLALPLKAGVVFGNKFYGYANAGLVPSLLLAAETDVPAFDDYGKHLGNHTFDTTERVSDLDVGGLLEVGVGYRLKGRYYAFSSYSYQHSFTSVTNSNYFAESKIRHTAHVLSVGMKYELTGK